jgi:hypothetical protein
VESRDKEEKQENEGSEILRATEKLTDTCCCKEFVLQTKYYLANRDKKRSEMFEPRQQGSGKYKVAT